MKGIGLTDPSVCTRATLATLSTIPSALRVPGKQPRIILISSAGITQESHKALPFAWRVLYPWLLANPHADKFGLERVIAHVTGRAWTDPEPPAASMSREDWQNTPGLPAAGEFPNVVVLRPAFFSEGKFTGKYKTSHKGLSSHFISRPDVAHFIVEGVLKNWSEWKGDCASIGY